MICVQVKLLTQHTPHGVGYRVVQPFLDNQPFFTMRAWLPFEPGSPDWETNALPTRPNRLPYHHHFSRVDIECNPRCARVSFSECYPCHSISQFSLTLESVITCDHPSDPLNNLYIVVTPCKPPTQSLTHPHSVADPGGGFDRGDHPPLNFSWSWKPIQIVRNWDWSPPLGMLMTSRGPCPSGGCLPNFRRVDDITRTISKGGCLWMFSRQRVMTSHRQCPRGGACECSQGGGWWRHAGNVQGGGRLWMSSPFSPSGNPVSAPAHSLTP